MVVDVLGFSGATGGTAPTVDIGTAGDDDGFVNELSASALGSSATSTSGSVGVLMPVRLTEITAVYGKVGASAATGGTFKGAVLYVIEDA